MTVFRDIFLGCNKPGCFKKFSVDPDLGLGFPPLSVVRRESRKAGWTIKRTSLGRRFDYDYCPAHPDGKEAEIKDGSGEEAGDERL